MNTLRLIPKPNEGEYVTYASMYIDLLPNDGLVLQHMQENLDIAKNLVFDIPEAKLTTRFAAGEWTIKEILSHIVDDERVFAYRALRFARNDPTELPGFDQETFATYSGANERSVASILEEFATVRAATLTLYNNFDDAALLRSGTANGNLLSVRGMAYHIAGHELHHINSIRQNYLQGG